MKRVVTADWAASYADPISVRAGDKVILTGRDSLWSGFLWLWAGGPDGREGWMPECLIERGQDEGAASVAHTDFNAMELTCRAGDVLQVLETIHGWALCTNKAGETGWVPSENLS